jgi:hypothetical protein
VSSMTDNQPAIVGDVDQRSTDPETTATVASGTSVANCTVIIRIGRALACCYNLSTWLCEECARIDTLLAPETSDPKSEYQLKNDRVESLGLATKEVEEENARLVVVLNQKKVVLAEKKTELKKRVPRNEFRRIIRDMGKKKEAGRG